jgi:hypothetical protein
MATIGLGLMNNAIAATELWDLPPQRYSDTQATDPIAKLTAEIASGSIKVDFSSSLDRLRYVLKLLEISEASQILVFSKTSKQNPLIQPENPRALYFNENTYVGYVPGGDIEVISHDSHLGPVFYMISNHTGSNEIGASRDTSDCLSCHGTSRTENVPGVLIRSVYPDNTGRPILTWGSFLTTHASPIHERWGGYYVTGHSSLAHLGNRNYVDAPEPAKATPCPALLSLDKVIDTSRYLRPTSDIVALMVLEHQCQIQNQLHAASIQYQRLQWLRKSLNPDSTSDDPSTRQFLDHSAERIADLMLFEDEAPLGTDGIDGDPTFQRAFTSRFPKANDGRSLADFQLNARLFKYRASYMVYSKTFRELPNELKSAIFSHLKARLNQPPSPENHPDIHTSEREKILEILKETIPDWPKN